MRQTSLFILLLAGLLTGCHSHKTPEALAHNLGVIPAPASVTSDFQPSEINSLRVFLPDSLTTDYLRLIVNSLPETSFSDESSANVKVAIDTILDEEEYTLEISSDKVTVRAGSSAGVQYALTSLGQIAEHRGYPLPVAVVRDKPKFNYRGMHLDVGRHFFDVADVKKYLDYMAMYKYNNFHWHLTEDQGWRIEIKKYPRLQEVAAFRKETLIGHYSDQPHKFDGKRYGGYYTQEEVREIVRYASDRHINVIPEIEMPGHSLAALAAYPQLGCRLDRTASEDGNTGKLSEGQDQPAYEVATKWGVFEDVYCPTEYTFGFLEDLLGEAHFAKAKPLEINTLANSVFRFRGGRGVREDLPAEVQVAPIYACADTGSGELMLAGNQSKVRVKLGRLNGNHGLVIRDPAGKPSVVSQVHTGLGVRGDVRGLATVKTVKGPLVVFGVYDGEAVFYRKNNLASDINQ